MQRNMHKKQAKKTEFMGQNECCTIEKCDIFDFMAKYVGLSVLHPSGFKATQELAEKCHINKNTKVIDIACGKGTTAVYLAKKFNCKVVGIDISGDLIDEANKLAERNGLNGQVSFHVGDALKLPFPDDEFDVAVSQAMLVLVNDKIKAIQEAMRVIKPGRYAGWVELSWKMQPPQKFMKDVSDVICAYCMRNVHTFDGWKDVFEKGGVKQIDTIKHSMDFGGMKIMLSDEGFSNSVKVMIKYLTNSRIRNRMKTLNNFFKDNPQYFGYGIYVCRK